MVPGLVALIPICLMAGCPFLVWLDPHHRAGRSLRWTVWTIRYLRCPHIGHALVEKCGFLRLSFYNLVWHFQNRISREESEDQVLIMAASDGAPDSDLDSHLTFLLLIPFPSPPNM